MSGVRYPTNIFLLCKDCEVDLEDLRLICIYCTNELTTAEVLSFAWKELCIKWDHELPYGACAQCLRKAAKVRELRHWSHSSYGATVEEETKTPLAQLYIRCHMCLKPLSSQEKEYLVQTGDRFHKIAGQWTGRCCHCRVPCTAIQQQ